MMMRSKGFTLIDLLVVIVSVAILIAISACVTRDLGPKLEGSFAIMADKNPSHNNEPATGVGPNKAPSNHGDNGEVYLTYGGQVEMKWNAEDSKVNGDDIYTIQKHNNANPATPANIDDQYIVRHPTDD
jgi:hypothetical protein